MSIRIRTRQEDELTLQQQLEALAGRPDRVSLISKFYMLRAALSLSLRMPIRKEDSPQVLRPRGSHGSEYRLSTLLGGEKSPDSQAELVRLLLSVGHGVDLFRGPDREKHFQYFLEYHIHRGFEELRRIWQPGQDVLEPLAMALKAGEPSPNLPEAPQSMKRLEAVIETLGIRLTVKEVLMGPRLARYVINLKQAKDYDKLKRGLEKIALSVGVPMGSLSLRETGEALSLELMMPCPREQWRMYGLRDLQDWLPEAPESMTLPMCPGVDILGNPYWIDLADCPHLLVAGTTGSGKSVAVHALLCSLLLGPSPDQIELKMVDPKKVEFSAYAGIPQLGIEGQALTDPDEIMATLNQLVTTMEIRYERLRELEVRDVGEVDIMRSRMKRIILVVDEIADLLMTAPEVNEALVRLAQKGRAAGIHMILATQRPGADLLVGLLRSNIPARIALAVQKSTESKIILDQVGAENLLKPGDMLIKTGGTNPIRVHGLHLRNDDVAYVIRSLNREDP